MPLLAREARAGRCTDLLCHGTSFTPIKGIPCYVCVHQSMQSQMTNILTHVVCKDEDNVRLFAGAEEGVDVDGAEE